MARVLQSSGQAGSGAGSHFSWQHFSSTKIDTTGIADRISTLGLNVLIVQDDVIDRLYRICGKLERHAT